MRSTQCAFGEFRWHLESRIEDVDQTCAAAPLAGSNRRRDYSRHFVELRILRDSFRMPEKSDLTSSVLKLVAKLLSNEMLKEGVIDFVKENVAGEN